MAMTVGELARRSGLTVRTLHHYDSIGLLRPALRSAAGYRLYAQADIERLHRIRALRQLGLSLTEIGKALSGPQAPMTEVLDQQIAQLDQDIAQASQLRQRLLQLRTKLVAGRSPEPADWLDTLERMSMFEKYFSDDELAALPLHRQPGLLTRWRALIGEVQAAIDRGVQPGEPQADALALRWMAMAGEGTGGNPEFLLRLHAMNRHEPQAREQSGISEALERFVEQAVVAARLAIFARYLDEPAMARLRANYGQQMCAWPALIAQVREAMQAGEPVSSPHVQALAQRWASLFRAYAGDDPADHARIREAYAREPDLRSGSSVDEPMLDYLRQAWAQAAGAGSS